MEPLPEKPAGCEIATAVDTDGVTLSWPAYKSDGSRFAGAGGLAFWLCCWAAGWLLTLRAIVNGQGHPFLYIWFAGWTIGGVAVINILKRMILPPTPETVRLEADELRYDPGSGPSEARSCAELPSGAVVPVRPAPATSASRSQIRGFGLNRVNDRQRLYLDCDDRRFEIGGCLTESEREWLFEVLQRWLGKPRARPWARGAGVSQEEAPS